MTVLNLRKTGLQTREFIASTFINEGFTIQGNLDGNFEVFGRKGDILLVVVAMLNDREKIEEEIEVKTFDEFNEWWPSIKKGLGMEP
jgi:hypothetical protein